tara:strand:- start:137 stop:361 length:225 start_codon:yes stop_codon:yes gene_type:complete
MSYDPVISALFDRIVLDNFCVIEGTLDELIKVQSMLETRIFEEEHRDKIRWGAYRRWQSAELAVSRQIKRLNGE